MFEIYDLTIGDEAKNILDKIDELRNIGLNKTISLPQIAVMGIKVQENLLF